MTQIWNEDVEINGNLDVVGDVDVDGKLQVGSFDNGLMATEDSLIEAHRAEVDTSLPKRGLHLLGAISNALNSVVAWVVHELELKGTGSLDALHTAMRVKLTNENTGTNGAGAELRGADVELNNTGMTTNAIPKATSLNVQLNNALGSNITEATALNIETNNDGGTIGELYALRTQGFGMVQFETLADTAPNNNSPSGGIVLANSSGTLNILALSSEEGQTPVINSNGDLVWTDVSTLLGTNAGLGNGIQGYVFTQSIDLTDGQQGIWADQVQLDDPNYNENNSTVSIGLEANSAIYII